MYTYGPPGYQPIGYNPMMNAQQRLAQLEQQYPQFSQQYPSQQYPNQFQQPQPSVIKGRAVTSFDEAKAAMIDLDGSLFVFTDVANNRIYTKQINLDGTATLNTYVRQEANSDQKPQTAQPVQEDPPVLMSTFNQALTVLSSEINQLKSKIGQEGGASDVQSNANASKDSRRSGNANGKPNG